MKKTAILVVLAMAALMMVACSKKAETGETATTAAAAEGSTTAVAYEVEGTYDADAINAAVAALDVSIPDVMGTVQKLGDYKNIELTADEHVVITDEDAMEYLETNALPSYTEEVTDAIKDGDTANIDYEGKKDGVAFEGGTAEGYDLEIGSGSFVDGFESGLIGHKAGETVDINLKFPENYQSEELAGQDCIFTVKINSVSRPRELDDALAAEIVPECKTVDELIAYIKDALQEDQDRTEEQNILVNAITTVTGNSELTPDEKAVAYTINKYVQSDATYLQNSYGMDLGTVLSTYYGQSLEEYMESYRETSVESVKQRIVLREIAKQENLTANDEDTQAFADSYGYTVDDLKEAVGEDLLKDLVLEDKANKFIVDNAKITYTAGE